MDEYEKNGYSEELCFMVAGLDDSEVEDFQTFLNETHEEKLKEYRSQAKRLRENLQCMFYVILGEMS